MKNAVSRSSRKSVKQYQIGWCLTVGVGSMLALIIALIMTPNVTTAWFHSPTFNRDTESTDTGETRIGTIAVQMGDEQCALVRFNNDTGQIVKTNHCKKSVVLDSNGVPVPMGSVHRLDSISKSFLGDKR
jgi:hypothetical protein